MDFAKDWAILPEDHAEEVIYGQAGGEKLRMLVMKPDQPSRDLPSSCLVFIHGGGFGGGTAETLLPQCRFFAKKGYVCFSVDYRLMDIAEDGSPAADSLTLADCIADCKRAMRYVRLNAGQWNGNPDRIALFGESAGGYLASAVTALTHIEAAEADLSVSCVPNLLVIYNPITQLMGKWKMRVEHTSPSFPAADPTERWLSRHRRAHLLSPLRHITARHPATLAVHGLLDTAVPPEDSGEYTERLHQLGVEAQLELFPECQHAFALTNYTASDEVVQHTLDITASFLQSQAFDC
ncbi:MAG: alpha/beta hydrolase [Paenibacillaceae bacterium]|jgi:acetyl esterase/lipase|nr:alpha/beta hydrolase [Paenibacillaceae bacterium]